MPSAGQKRLSRRCPRHARPLKNRVCALQESPPRPLRLVPSTPTRALTSQIAVMLAPRRPVYVPGLARAGREHRSKRCATWACRRSLDRGMRPRCRQQLLSAGALGPTCRVPVIGIGTGMGTACGPHACSNAYFRLTTCSWTCCKLCSLPPTNMRACAR